MAASPEHDERLTIAPIVGPDDPRHFTDSGIEIEPLYDEDDLPADLPELLGEPGEFPYTRGIHSEMYRQQTWTMRQYAGYASAKESNERYRYLLEHGGTGLSMAFDLPTQLGLDSDDPRCLGEVGRTGVAIDTIDDMRTAFDQIPLDQVSTSMTINAPASVLMLLYELVGEEQGVDERQAARHHAERRPQGVHRARELHLPARGRDAVDDRSLRLLQGEPPEVEHDLDLGLPLPREGLLGRPGGRLHAGQRDRLRAGGRRRRPRRSTTSPRAWRSSSTATTTSSRRSRSSAPRGRCGPRSCASASAPRTRSRCALRFHTQTGGVTLTAQQAENNVSRVALQGFAAVCGGTQSLHTNGFDEALALPTERAARIALRTQQIIAHESGATDTVDPFAGSYFVEALTDGDRVARPGADRQGRGHGRLGRGDLLHQGRDRGVGLGLRRALPHRPGHRRRRQQVRDRGPRGAGHPQGRPGHRGRPGRAPGGVQGRTATRRRSTPGSRPCARRPRGTDNLLPVLKDALRTSARWARSAAR